jgi:hypothetical protein
VTYPPAYDAPFGDLDPVLLTMGDIAVTRTHVILPHGRFPLRGSTWTVQDSTQVTESIPAYAIVLAIVFAIFCLLGLLFLLIKEKRYTGFVTISVMGEGFYHSAQFPAGPETGAWANYQVNQARGLAATA